jgi:hypothetical protein
MAALIRTIQGRMEAFNPRSRLPDDLKLLLKFMDGKRQYSDLQRALKPHICNEEKVQQLINQGLVEANDSFQQRAQHHDQQGFAFPPTVPAELSFSSAAPRPEADEWHASISQQVTDDDAIRTMLQEAKDCMADFLLRNAPQLAFEVLGEIEAFISIAQLQASMSIYLEQIDPFVSVAQKNQHHQQLRRILSGVSQPGATTYST